MTTFKIDAPPSTDLYIGPKSTIFPPPSVSDPDPHGSALNLSPGSAFRMRIRIQQLIKLAPKAKIIHII
jgi:hypothetical protein